MTKTYCRGKIILKKILVLLIFLTAISIFEPFCATRVDDYGSLDFDSLQWKVLNDSGWPGASRGYVEAPGENNRGFRFKYALKATELWPWPEVDFFVELKRVKDLSGYAGVQLHIKGERKNEEVYFYFLTKDKNLKLLKPCRYRFILPEEYRQIYLPFSQFKIAKDWTPRHTGFNPFIEWDGIKAFGFHKKGADREQGSISLLSVKFLQKEPSGITNHGIIRSLPPKHFLINLSKHRQGKSDIKITIYNSSSTQKNRTVSPYLYGVNWGVWLDLPDKEKAGPLSLKLIRAGGPFMDRCNWRNSKYSFPGNRKVLSMTDLDEFIKYCHLTGAEPLIQINALGYAPDEKNNNKFSKCMDSQDAADLVRYLNRDRGYNVRFFEIGNEPFIWHNVHFDVRSKPCSINEYFEIFKKISLAMKKAQSEIDPASKIIIFAPTISTSWHNWETLSSEDGAVPAPESFLKKCYGFQNNKIENPEGIRILDVLSFSLYPSFRDPKTGDLPKDIAPILKSTQAWWSNEYINTSDYSLPQGRVAEVLPRFKKWIEDNYPGTGLAVTEFNLESESMVEYEPVIKVLYLADLYGVMAKCGVNYAAQFCLNSSDHNIALIDDADNVTPLYYPFVLYARNFKGNILNTRTTLPEKLNVYACNNGGNIILMVINKEASSLFAEVILKDEEKNKDKINFFHNFPAYSLTCIKIPLDSNGDLAECWEYGERQINPVLDNNTGL